MPPEPPARSEPDAPSEAGRLIASRYRVQALLGEGGMGAVYRVYDEAQGVALALKRLRRDSEQDRLRFRREFHTLANLRHAGVVQVYEYGLDERGPFYTMELLEGRDLSEAAGLPVPGAVRVLRDVAETLIFLHSRRLLHRDLTPRNIRLDAQGRARLMDFGILATMGVPGEVAGTTPFIAPETLRDQPLDGRADLFSFGALAYWLLTGQHAYPARFLVELEPLWRQPPAPPSSLRPQVPPELDALVLSLLSAELLRRPRSATEVVERLDALLGERRPPRGQLAETFLNHPPLVGRGRQLELLRQVLERTLGHEAHGVALLVEGEAGSGKSRLLRELGLEAQLAGARVVRARAEPGSPSYGLVQALVRDLFTTAPAEARAAASAHAPVLARLPALRQRLATLPATPLRDASQERLRLMSALAAWLTALGEQRPLVLLVDDGHAADEPSLALLLQLVGLDVRRRVLVALAYNPEARPRAPEALASLRRTAASLLGLPPLQEAEVELLLGDLLGEGVELKALTRWLHRAAHGSPLHTLEVLRLLVERGTVRYHEGLWRVGDLSRAVAPPALADAFAVRLERLHPHTRAFAEALAVHEGPLPLALCVALEETADEAASFSHLDGLVRAEVLVGDGSTYRFRHAALREVLLGPLSPERLASLHRAMGHALQQQGLDEEHPAQTGWHLLRGGEPRQGARLLERVGRQRFEEQAFADALPLLEAAVQAYEQLEMRPRAVLELRVLLAWCGAFCQREVLQRHAPLAIEALLECAGLALARRLRPTLGHTLALGVALGVASARWLLTPPARRRVFPPRARVQALMVLACAATTANTLNDVAALERAAHLAQEATLWRSRLPYAMALYVRNMLALARADWQALERDAPQALQVLRADRRTALPPQFARITHGATRLLQLMPMWLLRQEPERFAQELEDSGELNIQVAGGYMVCLMAALHRLRGQEQQAQQLDAQAEVLLLHQGAGWGLDALRTRFCALAYALTRDVLGLKRTAQDLAHWVEQGAADEALLGLVQGDYHRERGALEESEATLRQALRTGTRGLELTRQGLLAALAETCLARGQPEQALAHAREAVALGEVRQRYHVFFALRAERALALALAASGQPEQARRRLEELLVTCAPMDNPLLEGLLHEALAPLARQAGDEQAAGAHEAAQEHCFQATANPALLARLRVRGASPGAPQTGPGWQDEMRTRRLASTTGSSGR